MNSCLYECRVMHRRLLPKPHHFVYRIFMFSLDLAEMPTLAETVLGFGYNRRALYAFNDRDHLAPDNRSVREKVLSFVRERGATVPDDVRIQLVTLPRFLGYIFNPVSFFYFYDAAGHPLCAVIEVGNTFREMKLFLAPDREGEEFRLRTSKHFYVSPFSTLDTEFDFRLRLPADQLDIHIDDYHEGRLTLVSALAGKRAPLTSAKLLWFTLKYPFITLKVISFIHWEAFRLWIKRVPFFAKADRIDEQREVLRPHVSLTTRTP